VGVHNTVTFENNFEVAASGHYHFIERKQIEAGLDLHYLLALDTASDLYGYPIVGVSASHLYAAKATDEQKQWYTRVGLNLGVGILYNITDRTRFIAEYRYNNIKDFSQALLSFGVSYQF
jgi:outer membrane autotransporter protein